MNAPTYTPNDPPYMQGLNPPQKQAVETLDGPVLVLAGAGTGKTRVLTTRLAHLLSTHKAMPGEILAVTFTNKAAQEMKSRVSDALGGQPVEGWWLGTFHSLAARMLRTHAELVGLQSNFTIIDPDDQQRLIKQLAESLNIDTKRWPPKLLISVIDRWKDKALTPDKVSTDQAGEIADRKMLPLYRAYQQRLKTVNACDFGDLLVHMISILQNPTHKDVLDRYHRRFRYILVDEYQDTNVAQYLWLRLLAAGSQNLCCVGDDDQSIYGWRGAEVGNILRFEKDFPEAVTVRLEQNYRSTSHILAAADGIIAQNDQRLGKTLWSDEGEGEHVHVHGLWDGAAEARWLAEQIETLHAKDCRLSDIAVLVRAGHLMREFEERFISASIPYRVVGGPRFYERMEIRDALAYFRVVAQPHDDLALERIVNTPKRGLGNTTIQSLAGHARATGISLHESIIQLAETDEIKPKQKETLLKLINDFDRWRSMVATTPHPELAGIILDESGYTDMWKADKSPDSAGRLENLKELVSAMADFESLEQFLEHVALVLDAADDTATDKVTIMTLHGAKGLEWPIVFLPGWEEGIFPSQRSMDESGVKGLEEERRLAYVGITRARRHCFISYTGNRRVYGNWITCLPSRFIDEIPANHKKVLAETGLYGSGSGFARSGHWDSSGFQPVQRLQPAETNPDAIQRGSRVFHEKFGNGIVLVVDGHKLDIQFDAAGRKRVMDSFVKKV